MRGNDSADGAAAVTTIYTGPFRFYDLPAEVRLNILESSDLLTPTREVRWDPVTGYKLPARGHTWWRAPRGFFAVSRAFYAAARKVFFERNRIVVGPHASVFMRWEPPLSSSPGPSPAPVDYAATTFFADVLTAGSFRHLRFLELPFFAKIPVGRKDWADAARDRWLLALRRAYGGNGRGEGDGAGLDGLRFLGVFCSRADVPVPDGLLGRGRDGVGDLAALRAFVKDRVWPMIEPESGTPRLPRQLLVDTNDARYTIRRKGEPDHGRDGGHAARFLHAPAISRSISWRPRGHDSMAGGHWVEAEDGEWIEEAWVRKLDTS